MIAQGKKAPARIARGVSIRRRDGFAPRPVEERARRGGSEAAPTRRGTKPPARVFAGDPPGADAALSVPRPATPSRKRAGGPKVRKEARRLGNLWGFANGAKPPKFRSARKTYARSSGAELRRAAGKRRISPFNPYHSIASATPSDARIAPVTSANAMNPLITTLRDCTGSTFALSPKTRELGTPGLGLGRRKRPLSEALSVVRELATSGPLPAH